MNKPTIHYIGRFNLPNGNAAAHRVFGNGEIFKSLDYRVIFYGVRGDRFELDLIKDIYHGFVCYSVPFGSCLKEKIASYFGLGSIYKILKLEIKENDILIVYNFPALAMFILFVRSKLNKYKLVSDTTDWYVDSGLSFFKRLIKNLDTFSRMRVLNLICNGLITTSPVATEFYKKRNKKLILELPTLFVEDDNCINAQIDDSKSLKTFVYAGSPFDVGRVKKDRSNVRDRLDKCIDIFDRLSSGGYDFIFKIYGITKNEFLSVYPEYKSRLARLDKKIYFEGRVSSLTVKKEISHATCTIFFRDSTREVLFGFPTKLSESLNLGVPVITTLTNNLNKYQDCDGIYFCADGYEFERVLEFIKLSPLELNVIKSLILNNKLFSYKNYISETQGFLEILVDD